MDAGDWIAVGSAGVAVCAAFVSWRQVAHAKGQAQSAERQVVIAQQQLEHGERVYREQNEPYVVVDIQPGGLGSGVLVVVVENIGSTIARNVQITADPPLESGWGDDLTQMLQRALSRSFPMLPPGRRLEFLLDEQDRFQNTDLPTAYTFTVRCEGPYGPMEDLEYVVDFGTYAETLLASRPLKRVEDRLGKIHGELKELTTAYSRSHAPAIREENERRLRQHRERMAALSDTEATVDSSVEGQENSGEPMPTESAGD
ncbi:hypothetical protein [Streptomyces sp. NPDC088915]|uniref:hypothetical protein n=1 Tax=Streptomyces sp. NPDC088915 TaxID=3365912 RepID=UPI003822C93E